MSFSQITSLVEAKSWEFFSASLSCCCAYSHEYGDVPWRLVDANGGVHDSYCIATLYLKRNGVGLGVENAGLQDLPGRYLQWPAYIRKGDKYVDKIREKMPFWIPPVLTFGESISPTKFLLLSSYGAPFLWDRNITFSEVSDVHLESGDSNAAIDLLVSANPDPENLRTLFGLKADTDIFVKYSNADRAILKKCDRTTEAQ